MTDQHDSYQYLRKYAPEQYALAELMLTHGFSVRSVARVTCMSEGAVMKISAGDIMWEIDVCMADSYYEGYEE